jgi:hypothetical protein
MSATAGFYVWFFEGLGGLGGWFIFFLLALAAVVWLLFDSSRRHLPALGWKVAVILLALLVLPAMIWRFSSAETRESIKQFEEAIFYLGLLGGILPVVLAVGYYFTYQGMVGCPDGHVYETVLGSCPDPSHRPAVVAVQVAAPPMGGPAPHPISSPKPKVNAWLLGSDGRSYQLNQGETTVGRSNQNDIQLGGDAKASKQHAKIVEQNGLFRLYDLGSTNGTFVNGIQVRQPVLLETNDEIRFGDNTTLRFTRR